MPSDTPESNFYQISGYTAHSNGWFNKYDDKPLIDAIWDQTKTRLFRPRGPDSLLELILGILPSGASYLLITNEQMLEFTHKHRLQPPRYPRPRRATDFVSLSPIYFASREALAAKIATYKQRPRNKNRRDLEPPQDNSQANRGYVKIGSSIEHYRGYFEQQRTLYRLLTRELDPGKVGMTPPPWLDSVRVVSLVFGEWAVDTRPRNARLDDPYLVNVGWTEASFPSFFAEQPIGTAIHLTGRFSRGRKNPHGKNPSFSQAAVDDEEGLYARLRTLLNHDAGIGVPLIVLVHDEEMARGILSRAGVDIDTWSRGLSNLVAPALNQHRFEKPVTHSGLPAPALVDTQKLVKAVMETSNPGKTVPWSAKELHMQKNGTRTCAGDDSLLQLRMWTSMAQGLAIDEQRKERLAKQSEREEALASSCPSEKPRVQLVAGADVDEDEVDPNDMPAAPRPTRADDFSDDDWW